MENNNNHSINDELLTRYLLKEAENVEVNAVEAWLSEAPENRKHLSRLKTVLDMVELSKIDTAAEWNSFKMKLKPQTKVVSLKPVKRHHNPVYWAVAASVAVLIGLTLFFTLFFNPKPKTLLAKANDKVVALNLTDGSTVNLNRNATLEYPETFGKENRIVKLNGEAFFSVAPDAERPFVVETPDFSVTVLGTAFFVSAPQGQPGEVYVEHGKVRCTHKSSGEDVTLTAGQKYTFGQDNNVPNNPSTQDLNAFAWKTARLIFENETMSNIAHSIEQTYGCKVVLKGKTASCVLTVTFEDLTLDGVLNVLETILDARINRKGQTVEIDAAGC